MKAYRVELLIVNHDNLSEQEIRNAIENARYANRCIAPGVMAIEGREIGEWDDSHPLNKHSTQETEYRRLFFEKTNS